MPAAPRPAPVDPAALALLARWGLAPGRPLAGWTAESIERSPLGTALHATLSRAEVRVTVSLKPASDQPRFARVGAIDLAHLPVDKAHDQAAGQATNAVVTWLRAQADGAELLPFLVAPPPDAARPAAPATSMDGPPSGTLQEFSKDIVHEAPPLDFARRAPPDRPFLKAAVVDFDDLEAFRDVLGQMYRHEFGCIVVRGMFAPAEMARLADLLESGGGNHIHSLEADATYEEPEEGAERSRLMGRPLDWADSMDSYLEEAAVLRRELEALFARAGLPPYEARLQEVLRRLGGGRDVRPPQHADGRPYGMCTVRYLTKGGHWNVHTENHIIKPNYAELREMVDPVGHLSQFLTVRDADGRPEEGALIVYSVVFNGLEFSERTDDAGRLDLAQWMAFKPGPGDLLIFDAGRYTHEVTKIPGARNRITIGGFLMFDRSNRTIHYMR
jgi:hypothetical protein